MNIEAIIFDSDGTLVDSEILSARVIVEIFRSVGAPVSCGEVLERFRGCRFAGFAETILEDFPVMSIDQFTRQFRARSAEIFARELKPMPGAVELVSSLKIAKCVASNGPRDKIERCLGVTGLLPHFEGRIASAYEVLSWKPDAGLILHASSMMGVSPSRCLLVEDSLAGIQAGLSAGVNVVGFRLHEKVQAEVGERVPVIQELADVIQLITV